MLIFDRLPAESTHRSGSPWSNI